MPFALPAIALVLLAALLQRRAELLDEFADDDQYWI